MARARKFWPWAAAATVVLAAVFLLRSQGRSWLCSCGYFLPWTSSAWSSDTSQHLFDPYSFTHVLHGFLFWWLFAWALPRVSVAWRFCLTVMLEALWEVVENSNFVIERYREATAALGYHGDTVVNSLGDIIMCATGFLLARRLGPKRTLALFLLTEIVLIVSIRDSLLLNIVMLIYPSESLKAWQAGH